MLFRRTATASRGILSTKRLSQCDHFSSLRYLSTLLCRPTFTFIHDDDRRSQISPSLQSRRQGRLQSPFISSQLVRQHQTQTHRQPYDGTDHHMHVGGEDRELANIKLRRDMEQASKDVTYKGMAANLGLSVAKFGAGIYGNSVAMVADACHSLGDLVSDAVTLWTVNMAHREADKKNPYGYGKYESVGALCVSSLLVFTGAGIGYHACDSIIAMVQDAEQVQAAGSIALTGAFFSIFIKEYLYRITKKVADTYHSKVIMANAWHHRTDAASSVVALLGVAAAMYDMPLVDPIAGLLVAGMIVKTGMSIGLESVHELTDTVIDPDVIDNVETILENARSYGVQDFHQLRGRRMGPYIMVDVHILVDSHLSVSASHQIAERVRLNIMDKEAGISEVLVHVDVEFDEEESTSLEDAELMRPQHEIERDVSALILNSEVFYPSIQGLSHFTCHYLDNKLTVQLDVLMEPNLTIEEAQVLACRLQEEIPKCIDDIEGADVHLELTPH